MSSGRTLEDYIVTAARAAADGQLTDIELAELHRLSMMIGMGPDQVRQAKIEAIHRMLGGFLVDGYLDSAELAILQNALNGFQLTALDLTPDMQMAIGRSISIHHVASGQLPNIRVSGLPINLASGEIVHACVGAKVIESKVVRRDYGGGYSGFSFRIAKGIRYHVGGSRGRSSPVYGDVCVAQGNLVLTSARALYLANARSFDKPWAKISAVEPYSDAMTFYLSGRQTSTTLFYLDATDAPIIEAICSHYLS